MIHMMTAGRKRPVILAAATCLAIAGLVFGFAFPSTAVAWDDCPKGVTTDCVYPGVCSRYIDTNGDDICDRSQSDPAAATTTATPATTTTVAAAATSLDAAGGGSGGSTVAAAVTPGASPSATGAAAASESDSGGGIPFFTHYLVSPIAIGFLLIYGVSSILYRTKRMRMTTHRKIWNVLLLATFLITGIFGIILTIQLDYRLPFRIPIDLLFWHVEAGIAMTLISIFHMAWHFNYYRNLVRKSRCKARAAEATERLRTSEQRQLALEARTARRAEHEHRPAPQDADWTVRHDRIPHPWVEPETQ